MPSSGLVSPELQAVVQQGYFGEGYVASIATAAGLDVQFPRLGHRVDLGIYLPGPNGTSGSRQVQIQVKSWSNATLAADGNYHYPLEVPAYNFLAGPGHDVRHYLALCVVPNTATDYTESTHDHTKIRHAAYWLSLRDEAPDPTLKAGSTKTVVVPTSQLLTPITLRALVEGLEAQAVVL